MNYGQCHHDCGHYIFITAVIVLTFNHNNFVACNFYLSVSRCIFRNKYFTLVTPGDSKWLPLLIFFLGVKLQ